jgi:hypothetical protein
MADAGIQHRPCGARQQGPHGYHDHDCRGTVGSGERQEDMAALFVNIGSDQANRTSRGDVGLCGAPVGTGGNTGRGGHRRRNVSRVWRGSGGFRSFPASTWKQADDRPLTHGAEFR